MDTSWLSRTQLLIGEDKLAKLTRSHVMVVGMGGVGSYAAGFICRSGIGKMTIIDGDVVDPTNRNRQLPALAVNHGKPKADIMAERLKEINPELELTVEAVLDLHGIFYEKSEVWIESENLYEVLG